MATLADALLAAQREPRARQGESRESPQQYLRVRYFLAGVLIMLLGGGLVLYAEWNGLVRSGAAMKLILCALVFQGGLAAVFFSGLNLRFSDKALTVIQVFAYLSFESAMVLIAAPVRHIVLIWFCLSLTMSLTTIRFGEAILVSLLALSGYLAAVAMSARWGEIAFYFPEEVFATGTFLAYLIVFCAAAKYLEARRRFARDQRQATTPLTRPELGPDTPVRELRANDFLHWLRQFQQEPGERHLALTEFSLVNARLILAEQGRHALRAVERQMVARLRTALHSGALLCASGEGKIWAIHFAPSQANALAQAQAFCREESDTVLVLPGTPKPVAVQYASRTEAIG